MAHIAIVGPGAVGGVVAAWLGEDRGHEVVVCARTPFASLHVKTPEGVLNSKPKIVTNPKGVGAADWVLVATKTYDVSEVGVWLERLVAKGTRVAVLQNGVEHTQRFAPFLPDDRIVPAVVDIPASRSTPGQMVQHRLGSIVAPQGQNGADFVVLFKNTKIDVAAVPDWTSRAWRKLCHNCAGAVTTLTLRSTGPVWSPEIESIVRGLVSECAAVGRAEGAVIEDALIKSVVDGARNAPEGSSNSMHANRLAGRPMELDARNGVIVRLGAKHGISTPVNAMMVALLQASDSPWIG